MPQNREYHLDTETAIQDEDLGLLSLSESLTLRGGSRRWP